MTKRSKSDYDSDGSTLPAGDQIPGGEEDFFWERSGLRRFPIWDSPFMSGIANKDIECRVEDGSETLKLLVNGSEVSDLDSR